MNAAPAIRPVRPEDAAAVRALLEAAFPTAAEADLVERLRADADAVFDLAAEVGGVLAGHVLFSRMRAPERTLGLGPVAVRADARRRGIAHRLIEAGLTRARADGWRAVFVLGDPATYTRFGFSTDTARAFDCVYAGPYMMGLVLDETADLGNRIDYAKAFEALS